VPVTNAVLGAAPTERSGIASAVLNNSREVAGLLGITVIGAVLRTRESVALRHAVPSTPAFIDGYHAGLAVTIALVAVGAAVGYVTLRRASRPAAEQVTAATAGPVSPGVAETLAAEEAHAGPRA
jgi:hypothetical protein